MAIRQNKSQDEDKPSKRFSLIGDLDIRSGYNGKHNERLYNFYVEKRDNNDTKEHLYRLIRRPGCSLVATTGSGTFRGIYYYGSTFYIIFGNQIWTYRSGGSATLHATGLTTSSGPVGFTEYKVGTTDYLFLADGQAGFYILDNAPGAPVITQIADPQFPNPHVPNPVFMDGYIFLIGSYGRIYNSDLNNITSWSDQYIVPELYADNTIAIKKHNNQIIAFSQWSIEFFYDAGNTSSSPLSRNEGTSYQLGSGSPWAIASAERYIIWPSQSKAAGRAVHMFDGFQLKKISTDSIEKFLFGVTSTDWYSNTFGDFLRLNGHLFYVLTLPAATLVYDVETEYWSQWTWNNNGSHTKWLFTRFAEDKSGKIYSINDNDDDLYEISAQYMTDNTIDMICEIYTREYDGETMSRKFNHGLYVVGNRPGVTANCDIRWSDDNYQTWSGTKTVNLNARAFLPRLGAFRRRAFNLKVIEDCELELEALEFTDMQTGNH